MTIPKRTRSQKVSKDPKGRLENRKKAITKFNRTIKCHADADVLFTISSLRTSVCAIIAPGLPADSSMAGTGFVIGKGLIISNYHVIVQFIKLHNEHSHEQVEIKENLDMRQLKFSAVACFHSDFLEQKNPEEEFQRQKMSFKLGKIRAFQKEESEFERDLDYVIIEIENIPNYSNFNPLIPNFDYLDPRTTDEKNVLHPVHIMGWKIKTFGEKQAGGVKVIDVCCLALQSSTRDEFDMEDGRAVVVQYNPAKVKYRSDLYKGSSGSPVFNNRGRIIALHTEGICDLEGGYYEYSYVRATMILTIYHHVRHQFPSLDLKHMFPGDVTSFPNVFPGSD